MVERRIAPDCRGSTRGGRRHPDHAGRPIVLIVDNHVDSRELMAAVLKDAGVVSAEAGTGKEALARAGTAPSPALILIDLSLPDCHGTDVVRALKLNPVTCSIPVVALSASVRAEDKVRAAGAGCVAFLEKPVLPDDVVDIVRRILAAAGAG